MIYLIDFENVSNSGFDGVETLTANDKLIIFYSEKNSTINMAVHKRLENSPVKKEYLCIKAGGKNALDMQLSTYLGYLVSKHPNEEYAIVSKDKGFDFILSFWESQSNKVQIQRFVALSGISEEGISSKVVELLPTRKKDATKIASIINKFKTKQAINNALVKEFTSKDGGEIYQTIKPLIKSKN